MKKIFAVILAVILLSALAVPVIAAPDGENMGTIPMTNIPIIIDGIKDDVYNHGLIVPIDQPNSDAEGSGGGTAYFLWSADGYLYIFQEFKVNGWHYPANYELFSMGKINTTYSWYWILHSTEISIDFNNEGMSHSKFVAGPTDGFISVHVQDDIGMGMGNFSNVERAVYWLEGSPERYFEAATRIIDDNNYTVEFKIDFNAFIRDGVATKGPFVPGSELGINMMVAEILEVNTDNVLMDDDGFLIWEGWANLPFSNIAYKAWDTDIGIESRGEFNYLVLGELTAATTLSAGGSVDTPADTGGDAGSDTGSAGGGRTNHQHGDAGALFALLGVISFAVYKRAKR
jgi:hypothetical protein